MAFMAALPALAGIGGAAGAGAGALGAVSSIASLGGTVLGAVGQGQQASATAAQANYAAQVAKNNQMIADQNARYAMQAAATNAQQQDFRTAQELGTARAAYGASGVDPTTGSPTNVMGSIGQMGRLRTLQDIQQGLVQAYGYQSQAAGFGAEAGLQQAKAASAQAAAPIAIGGTILGGAGSLADKWQRFQLAGVGTGGGSTGGGTYPGDWGA
jgi:hypothetical protein